MDAQPRGKGVDLGWQIQGETPHKYRGFPKYTNSTHICGLEKKQGLLLYLPSQVSTVGGCYYEEATTAAVTRMHAELTRVMLGQPRVAVCVPAYAPSVNDCDGKYNRGPCICAPEYLKYVYFSLTYAYYIPC